MAKEQDLPLSPDKITGICGRTLCCLAYENKDYIAMKEKMPRPGQEVSTPFGEAKVVSVSPDKRNGIS
jgi:cell fate regulator YaaT (PSP1 superfamily)